MKASTVNLRAGRSHAWIMLSAILIVSTLLRLRGLAFGLPALYDPDEPIFGLIALKLLGQGTLNPGWFGHPGTTTIYTLALIYLSVLGVGLLTGRFESAGDFARAIYADPGVAVLPGRLFIVLCGLATILLAFVLARRLFGARAGLIAAALLAVSPVHVKYSQIIRTDMHETVFLLLGMLACTAIVHRGRLADHLWAGIWLGLAVATKWPAATIVVAIVGATVCRIVRNPLGWRLDVRDLAIVGAAALATLIAASPFLVLDFATALANVTGEARTQHIGATGYGFLGNIGWYLATPLQDAFGLVGLVGALIGLVVGSRRSTAFAVTLVPFVIVSFIAISAQGIVWERWIVPLLPFLAIALAGALDTLITRLRISFGPVWSQAGGVGALALVALAPVLATEAAARERANDTRAAASAWARAHIPAGATVIVEQPAFDLLRNGWRFLYPLGNAGCIDVAASLKARISYATVERWRGGRAVVDIGTIAPRTFATCRADYAILVDYDRYRLEPVAHAGELAVYRALIAQGNIAATFAPVPGRIGGPTVRVVRLDPHSPGWDAAQRSGQLPFARLDRVE